MAADPWVYEVTFQNADGEHRTVVVELAEEERLDHLWNHALGVPCAAGADASPIINSYVAAHGYKLVPEGFECVFGSIKRIEAPNVRALQ